MIMDALQIMKTWTVASFGYMVSKYIIFGSFSALEIKLFLLGNALFNFKLSTIYNDYAVGFFKNKKSEIPVFVFGLIYAVMIFYKQWFDSPSIWKINIGANLLGAVANLTLHRKIDNFWWLNLNDPNKAIIYTLIFYSYILNKDLI
eukprot:296212_1